MVLGKDGNLERWDRVGDLAIFSREWPGPTPICSPPVVMVHGLSVSSRYMIPTAGPLSARYRVLALDLPGFGRSDRPAKALDVGDLAEVLAQWIEQVGARQSLLIGNSMGCQIAAEMVLHHPEMVVGLVLTGPTVDPARQNSPQQVGRWLLNIPREPRSLLPVVFADYLTAGPRRTFLSYVQMMRHRMEDVLPCITVPTLVVRGGRDPIVPGDWARRAAKMLARGALVEIPSRAHAVNFNSPAELARVVEDFTNRAGIAGWGRQATA